MNEIRVIVNDKVEGVPQAWICECKECGNQALVTAYWVLRPDHSNPPLQSDWVLKLEFPE